MRNGKKSISSNKLILLHPNAINGKVSAEHMVTNQGAPASSGSGI